MEDNERRSNWWRIIGKQKKKWVIEVAKTKVDRENLKKEETCVSWRLYIFEENKRKGALQKETCLDLMNCGGLGEWEKLEGAKMKIEIKEN